jgi:hypothetical protein
MRNCGRYSVVEGSRMNGDIKEVQWRSTIIKELVKEASL